MQGHADTPLDDIGTEQARRLGAHFGALGILKPHIYSSDLRRAYATAEAIQAAVGGTLSTHPELREIFMGDWEGQLYDDIQALQPEHSARFWGGDPQCSAPNGETPAQVGARVHDFLQRHWPAPGQNVILVSHGVAVSALLARLLGLDYQQEWASERIMHRNTAYSVLMADAYTREIQAVQIAATPHLQ